MALRMLEILNRGPEGRASAVARTHTPASSCWLSAAWPIGDSVAILTLKETATPKGAVWSAQRAPVGGGWTWGVGPLQPENEEMTGGSIPS